MAGMQTTLRRPCGSGTIRSMVRGGGGVAKKEKKMSNSAACLSATAPHDWTQTFTFSVFAVVAVAAAMGALTAN